MEDLQKKRYKGKKINYLEMLKYATQIIQELKLELVQYFDTLVENAIYTGEKILNTRYLIKKYIEPAEEDLTDYGYNIRTSYNELLQALEDLKAIKTSSNNLGSNNSFDSEEMLQ